LVGAPTPSGVGATGPENTYNTSIILPYLKNAIGPLKKQNPPKFFGLLSKFAPTVLAEKLWREKRPEPQLEIEKLNQY